MTKSKLTRPLSAEGTLEHIYRCEAARTLREGAEEFARFYFSEPRRVRDFAGHDHDWSTFSVSDGARSYISEFVNGRVIVGRIVQASEDL